MSRVQITRPDGMRSVDETDTIFAGICVVCVLSHRPYRQQGLGSKLIHHVLSTAAESLAQPPATTPPAPAASSTPTPKTNGTSPAAPSKGGKTSSAKPESTTKKDDKEEEEKKKKKEPLKPRVESVYLHVQVGNDEAKRFWEKWGFEVKVHEEPSLSFSSAVSH